ncbi:MAG: serine/threonine-protein kinase [Thermoanaerobaculia bacterium]
MAPPQSPGTAASSVEQGRFIPGTVLAKRYRVIGLLGRGGMGEVYRADDLKLGQPVALKFLPRDVERDEGRLQRFLNEVRMALKVTHPNVTRVFDIGEVDGHHYISMEYVDGEDLSSLLLRIGRLPKDKAVQVARQICAGLAAAHDQGVLHRDLKPANVMLDGRGQVKITDFGLAGLDQTIEGAEAQAGTPAYMAPEQWAAETVTAQTDIYALGLVLYELFTGQSVFAGKSPAEILELQQKGSSTVTSPSAVIEGFDPAVERVILKSMEKNPASRPRSALAVSAALPGGDPLAAALAAGETPSPELVAQAGAVGGLQPWVAGLCAAVVLLGTLAAVWSAGWSLLPRLAPLKRPPSYLAARAQEILADLRYEEPPADSVSMFEDNPAYVDHLTEQGLAGENRHRLRSRQPAVMKFRYRQSPNLLERFSGAGIGAWMLDPPGDRPGMIQLDLDPLGRLTELTAIPWEVQQSSRSGSPEWIALFEAAGLDMAAFEGVEPEWTPPVFAGSRRAWTGVYPEAEDIAIRIEAAGLADRIVWFRIIEPWTEPIVPGADSVLRFYGVPLGFLVWFMIVILVGSVLAWRNLRLGRGDRRGAFRLALLFGAARMSWLLAADHMLSGNEIRVITSHFAYAAYRFCLVWIFYIALEPYARRLWPHMLTSWMRLLDGRLRDPLVGRDVLVGTVMGAAMHLLGAAVVWTALLLDIEQPLLLLDLWTVVALRGGRHLLGAVGGLFTVSIWNLFMVVMMFLLLKLLLRKTWVAVVVESLMMGGLLFFAGPGDPRLLTVWAVGTLVLFWFILIRFGLVSMLVGFTVQLLLGVMPLTFDLSAWYSGSTWITVLVIAALTAWGFYVSLAGLPVFKDELLRDQATS